MSYSVARRTREIGIRVALGAERSSVLWLVLREVTLMVIIGLAIGVPLPAALSRVVQSQLFALSAHDPLALAGAAIVLVAVALVAGYLPARRATRIDPMLALQPSLAPRLASFGLAGAELAEIFLRVLRFLR
jgi:ABC-type antimicrobial peptide transport system permease subunit